MKPPTLRHRGLARVLLAAALGAAPTLATLPATAAIPDPAAIERPSAMQVQDLAHRADATRLAPAAAGPRAATARAGSRPAPAVTYYNGSGLSREVLGFATYYELAAGNLNDVQLDKISTLAFFGLTLDQNGNFFTDSGHAAEQNAW
ncbi:MAG TPA: hypothetical protein VG245_00360, partial [Candidatus Dormibacteraeota bacterium]|nr:hypothetical protein [Candidatus Dormibacteraeota bacterium]